MSFLRFHLLLRAHKIFIHFISLNMQNANSPFFLVGCLEKILLLGFDCSYCMQCRVSLIFLSVITTLTTASFRIHHIIMCLTCSLFNPLFFSSCVNGLSPEKFLFIQYPHIIHTFVAFLFLKISMARNKLSSIQFFFLLLFY